VCDPKYCELQRWREIIDLYQDMSNVKVLGLIETKEADGNGGFKPRSKTAIEDDIKLYKDHVPTISGFYFNEVGTNTYPVGTETHTNTLLEIAHSKLADRTKYFVAFGVGEPLFDTSAVVADGAPDLWVTLTDEASSLGVWTPYSWFSSLANGYTFASTNWGAVVSGVTDAKDYGTAMIDA
jgi:hypothetical protein